jgi:hypothetical protein
MTGAIMCKLPTPTQLSPVITPQMQLNSQRALALLNNMLASLEASKVSTITQGSKTYVR